MDRAIELDFFSTTPEKHWREDQGLRDCVAQKGLTSKQNPILRFFSFGPDTIAEN